MKKVFFRDQIKIDIILKLWGHTVYHDVKLRSKRFLVGKISIPTISLEDLIKSKDTDRNQDKEDVKHLKWLLEQQKRK